MQKFTKDIEEIELVFDKQYFSKMFKKSVVDEKESKVVVEFENACQFKHWDILEPDNNFLDTSNLDDFPLIFPYDAECECPSLSEMEEMHINFLMSYDKAEWEEEFIEKPFREIMKIKEREEEKKPKSYEYILCKTLK